MSKTKSEDFNENIGSFLIPYEKKKIIFSVLLFAFAVLIALSIISYSPSDYSKINDITISNLPSILDRNSSISLEIAKTKNWLGLFGAFISYFFINGTIGYFSLIIPILMGLWSFAIVKNLEIRKIAFLTNLFLLSAILFSTLVGILSKSIPFFSDNPEICGVIGLFLGDVSIRILGGAGSLIVITALLLLTSYLIIDFDIYKLIELPVIFVKNLFIFLRSKIKKEKLPENFSFDERNDIGQKNQNKDVIEKEKKTTPRTRIITPEPIIDTTEKTAENKNDNPNNEEPRSFIIEKIKGKKSEEKNEIVNEENSEKPKNKKEAVKSNNKNDSKQSKEAVEETNKELQPWDEELHFMSPTLDLLDNPKAHVEIDKEELSAKAELLRAKLALFDIQIDDITVTPGPVVTLYEIVPAPGVKISRIVSLQDDIALALAAKGIRIIAPIPGKSAIGVEIPNNNRETIYCKSIIGSQSFKEAKVNNQLPLAFGKNTIGEIFIDDLTKMPHLLIAGATGSGKSVGINSIIISILYSKHPSDVKFVIIDPKKIELSFYKGLKKHFLAICPDVGEDIITNSQNAVTVLKSVELEMEYRYDLLAKANVRHITDYNHRVKTGRLISSEEVDHHKMPYLIVIIDELADLMITASREIEEPIARLAQMARAVGIHLILATQRPSVDVLTGYIKANFNARIAYQVATKIDSRTILDQNGAEQLLGHGDMLYLPGSSPKAHRLQNAFVSTPEVEKIVEFIEKQDGYSTPYLLPSLIQKKKNNANALLEERDEYFEEAAQLFVKLQQCSVSLLQRKFKIGYARAARVVDQLEEAGIVGPFDGSKGRLVLVESMEQLERLMKSIESQ